MGTIGKNPQRAESWDVELLQLILRPDFFLSLPKDMLIDFRERGRKGERGRQILMQERNIDRSPLIQCPNWDQTRNLGMCPD